MSFFDAAGCALSSVQSVSVVPMIQCRPHGITKSTEVSVRTMNPASERILSRGTISPIRVCGVCGNCRISAATFTANRPLGLP